MGSSGTEFWWIRSAGNSNRSGHAGGKAHHSCPLDNARKHANDLPDNREDKCDGKAQPAGACGRKPCDADGSEERISPSDEKHLVLRTPLRCNRAYSAS